MDVFVGKFVPTLKTKLYCLYSSVSLQLCRDCLWIAVFFHLFSKSMKSELSHSRASASSFLRLSMGQCFAGWCIFHPSFECLVECADVVLLQPLPVPESVWLSSSAHPSPELLPLRITLRMHPQRPHTHGCTDRVHGQMRCVGCPTKIIHGV